MPNTATYTGTLRGSDEVLQPVQQRIVTQTPPQVRASNTEVQARAISTGQTGRVPADIEVRNTGTIEIDPANEFNTADPYFFMGSMSEEVMHRYLGRIINMDFLCNSTDFISLSEYNDDINMLLDLKPKIVLNIGQQVMYVMM